MRRRTAILAAMAALTCLAACASQPASGGPGAPGFFLGLIQGWLAPLELVVHLFDHHVRMYAYPNSGGWYDFGFFLGIGSLGGGAASARS